jgi:DNA-binding GntR family transcriptional regulator
MTLSTKLNGQVSDLLKNNPIPWTENELSQELKVSKEEIRSSLLQLYKEGSM